MVSSHPTSCAPLRTPCHRLPDRVTMDPVRETVRAWQPYYPTPISIEKAVAGPRRVGRLFRARSGKRAMKRFVALARVSSR